MSAIIRIKGDKEIIKKIKLLEKKGSDELKKAILESVIHVEGEAKKASPFLTGRLRASITHEVKSIGVKHQGRVGTNVPYAPILEFGFGQPAQPYLIPALVRSKGKINQILTRAIARLK